MQRILLRLTAAGTLICLLDFQSALRRELHGSSLLSPICMPASVGFSDGAEADDCDWCRSGDVSAPLRLHVVILVAHALRQ